MYTRVALGKNTALDVVSGETSGSTGQLFVSVSLAVANKVVQCTRIDHKIAWACGAIGMVSAVLWKSARAYVMRPPQAVVV